MRIDCPHCGPRDRREFSYRGAVLPLPEPGAADEAWFAHVYLRDNPAGPIEEYWQHEGGCRAWLVATRDTISHRIHAVRAAAAR